MFEFNDCMRTGIVQSIAFYILLCVFSLRIGLVSCCFLAGCQGIIIGCLITNRVFGSNEKNLIHLGAMHIQNKGRIYTSIAHDYDESKFCTVNINLSYLDEQIS